MFNKLKIIALITLGFLPLGLMAAAPAVTYADTQSSLQSGVDQASGNNSANTDPGKSIANTIGTILNVLSAIAGVAAVIMVVVAGFRLVVGAGSEGSVKSAKGAIIYAVVGIIIVALAQVIVHFVIYNITSTADANPPASPYDPTFHGVGKANG